MDYSIRYYTHYSNFPIHVLSVKNQPPLIPESKNHMWLETKEGVLEEYMVVDKRYFPPATDDNLYVVDILLRKLKDYE